MMTEIQRQYDEFQNNVEHVWGVLSINDPLSENESSLWTMNDIRIIHHTDTNEYSVELNGAVGFSQPNEFGPKEYIGGLLERMREWMVSTGHDVNYPVNTYELFVTGANVNTRYASLEELYSSFNKLASGFINSCSEGKA